jgi:hypothetical protein
MDNKSSYSKKTITTIGIAIVSFWLVTSCGATTVVFIINKFSGQPSNFFLGFKDSLYFSAYFMALWLPAVAIQILFRKNDKLQFTLLFLYVAVIFIVPTYFIPSINPEIFSRWFEQISGFFMSLGLKPLLANIATTIAQIATAIATIEGCIAFYQRIFSKKSSKRSKR